MSNDFKFDVFLSHNSKDKPRVRRLAERLKQAGLRVWFDEWNIKHGDIIAIKVDEGLEQSRVLLLCISPTALASGWVALERSTAIHRDPSNEGRRFIPLLLAECELPDTLRRYKYVDFREESEDTLMEVFSACNLQSEESHDVAQGQILSLDKKISKQREKGEIQPSSGLDHTIQAHSKSWVRVRCLARMENGSFLVRTIGKSQFGIRRQEDD